MAIVFTAVLGATVLVLWNARTGARTIGSVYVDVARDNGATSTYALYREVLLPGAMPLVLVGIRLGLSTSLLIVVAVEFVAGGDGLGYVLWTAWLAYRLADLWAALVAVGTIGVAVTYGLAAIQRFLVPWNAQDRQPAVI
jgi:NitT/TauT family transport system permease protein